MKLIAYHGKQQIKDFYLERIRAHAAADEIKHGFYWQEGKGCAVGCTIHGSSHAAYEVELGIPRILAKLEDGIFEGIANGRSKAWPEQFLSAISVGADLSLVWPKFAVWMLTDAKWGVIQYANTPRTKKSIQDVSDAYEAVASGTATEVNWSSLRTAAAAAAADAADADAYAAADAAAAAAAAADAAAADAGGADDAADAAAYAADGARQNTREAQADKLLELLEAAK